MHTVSPRALQFDGYTLDLMRCALLQGEKEIALRPKPFDVLRYLAEHAGRLVSKEELIQAVWCGLFVTDDSLVQCIGEIREALSDDARQIIKTVPRRGYLLDTIVVNAETSCTPSKRSLPLATLERPHSLVPRRVALTTLLLVIASVGWGSWILSQSPSSQASRTAAPLELAQSSSRLPLTERRVALVIGNSTYGDGRPFANPRRDAEAMAKALKDVDFSQVTLRLDLNQAQFSDALDAFANDAAKADWAVVYFAGRGVELAGVNYLVPTDVGIASESDVALRAVKLNQVLRRLSGASKLRLIILDACRDDPYAARTTYVAAPPIDRPTNIETTSSVLIAYATKHGQNAEDGIGANSPFTSALIRNIGTPGLDVDLLFRKVRDEVLAATTDRQEPFIYGSLSAEKLYFRLP